jgi:hypothetical protein
MYKWLIGIFLLMAGCKNRQSERPENYLSENIIIITIDGLRWQEVFTGMDPAIAVNGAFNEGDSSYLFENYWSDDTSRRRKMLMPFFWKTIADNGQIYGNRLFSNYVDVANPFRISYPGYNEIFTGYPDTNINNNKYKANPNITVLEFLNQQDKMKGRVAAFCAWNAFDRILNEQRSGIPVFSGFDVFSGNNITENEKLIHAMMTDSYRPWLNDECQDVFIHYTALEYLKSKKPKVLYISYGETDEWAHAGKYRSYLDAARQVDAWINKIWEFVQSDANYKDKTAMFITTDHGRGDDIKEEWTEHNKNIADCYEMWFAVMGPGLKARGEVKEPMQLYQKQFAQTFAKILGYTYKADHPIADEIKTVFK